MQPNSVFVENLETPCYAVIFSSLRTEGDNDYAATADRMQELAATMPGYLGIESARGGDGFGITVSYWRDEASIEVWRRHAEHVIAQERGKRVWYQHYEVRVARVERAWGRPAGV